jgi:hypothetical protein
MRAGCPTGNIQAPVGLEESAIYGPRAPGATLASPPGVQHFREEGLMGTKRSTKTPQQGRTKAARDLATRNDRQVTGGKRTYASLTITKHVDKSTP